MKILITTFLSFINQPLDSENTSILYSIYFVLRPHKIKLKFKFKSSAKYFNFGPERLEINL